MKTPRILFFQTPRIWLSLLCTAALLLAGCSGSGAGADSVAGTADKHKAVVKALWNAMADIKSRSKVVAEGAACASAAQRDACQTAINQVVSASLSANSELSTSQLLSSLKTEVGTHTISSQSNNLMAAAVVTQQAPGFSNPGVGDAIVFSVRSVPVGTQSVTWNFGEGATPDRTKTLDVTNNSVAKATASFNSAGIKTVTVVFNKTPPNTSTTDTLNITIDNDNSLPTVRITGAVSNNQFVASGGKAGADTVLVRGSYRGTLGAGYVIKVFDGTTPLGDATVNANNKTWTYTTGTLDGRVHEFKAVVVSRGLTLRPTISPFMILYK